MWMKAPLTNMNIYQAQVEGDVNMVEMVDHMVKLREMMWGYANY